VAKEKVDIDEPEVIVSPVENVLLKQIDEYNELLSPSPPPQVKSPKSREKRYSTRTKTKGKVTKVNPINISLLKQRFDETDTLANDEVTIQDIVEELSILLKIRVHGAIEKYKVKKSDPLATLITSISKRENVEPGFISLNWGSMVIDPTQSAKSLGLTIADIIECYIYENIDKENEINIKIRSASQSLSYKVHLNESVERVMKDFCDKNGGNLTTSKFSLDGEVISDISKTTFFTLDVIEGDIIDAVLS